MIGFPSWFDSDNDADWATMELQTSGRERERAIDEMLQHFDAGDLKKAALSCPHGWEYPLESDCARDSNDPNAGEEGYRCIHCGSRLEQSSWDNPHTKVLVPCEMRPDKRPERST